MKSLNHKTHFQSQYLNLRKIYSIPKYIIIIFLGLFLVSMLLNVKLLLFPKALSLTDVPFGGRITEADSKEIIVEGFGENIKYFRDSYRIPRSDEMKIVNEEGESISFDDLKPGMFVSVRVVNYEFNFKDMDTVTVVTRIKCSESKEKL